MVLMKKIALAHCLALGVVICVAGYANQETTSKKQQPSPAPYTMLLPDMPTAQQHMEPINPPAMPLTAAPMTKEKKELPQDEAKLDFEVENKTGKTIFVTCFSYIKRRAFTRWRWDKSNIYELKPGQSTLIDIDYIDDPRDRKNVFGYLAIFNSQKAAQEAVYELLPESIQLDLDQIEKLKGQKVVIEVEQYGAKGEFYEYDFVKKTPGKERITKFVDTLDFPIENKTGKPLYVVCFTYEKKAKGTWIGAVGEKDDMALWHYVKEPIMKLMPGQIEMMHITNVVEGRDQVYVQGFLGIYEENEEKLAQDATYEKLPRRRRLVLGRLYQLEGQKVILDVEKYGISNDFIDYRIKPIRAIDFTKIKKRRTILQKGFKKQ